MCSGVKKTMETSDTEELAMNPVYLDFQKSLSHSGRSETSETSLSFAEVINFNVLNF